MARNRRILLVDDMPAIHDDFRKSLVGPAAASDLDEDEALLFGTPARATAIRFEPDSAYQGAEAVDKLRAALAANLPYAMAFVDMRMPPGWDGVETVERLWREDPELQIVLCTAYSDYQWTEVLSRLDVADRLLVLKKPFDAIEVYQLASALTMKWEMTRQAASKTSGLEQAVAERTKELSDRAAALHDNQRMLRGIIDQFPAKIAATDKDLRFIVVNSACARELGCLPEEAVGRRRTEFPISGMDATAMAEWSSDVMRRDLAVLASGQPAMNVEDKLTYADGRVDYLLTSKAPLFDASDAVGGVITVALDINEQKRAETERRALERQLQHAQKIEALGQLAGGIAHDLNNALVPILAMTELVLRDTPAGGREHRSLELVMSGARRARELVAQILAFSRREQAARREFDLAAVAREALMMLRASIPSTIALVDSIEPTIPIIGDPGQLHQVLVNLVMNAAQAIGDRQGTVTLLAQRESDGAQARLSVADTGCGMDGVTRERVFEPFFTTKEVGKGTGLGLSIVHGIVTNHGGTIAVESAPGHGTRFDIVMPTGLGDAATVLPLAG